jgi:Ca2+-binding RTX toxin-like protein
LISDDKAIRLYEADGMIFGSTAETEAELDADNTVFALSVDADGVVTLTQSRSVDADANHGYDHESEDDDDEGLALLGDGILELVANAVTTDSEEDSSTQVAAALDLGGNVRFGKVDDDDDDHGHLRFLGNNLLNAGTSGANTTVAGNAILFTVVAEAAPAAYSFDGNPTTTAAVGSSNETFTMEPDTGVVRTTNLAFDTLQILTLTTPTAELADGTETETVTVVLGLNTADDTIDRADFDEDHVVYGFGGNDAIVTGRGDDWIKGGTGADTIEAGRGNDTIVLANNDFVAGESIDGGRDRDTIVLANATLAAFTLGTITDVEALLGSTGNDRLTMSAEQWAAFSDIDLGDGSGDQLTVNVTGTVDISEAGSPALAGIETGRLTGSTGDDIVTITGEQLDAILIAAGTINLDGGADTIRLVSTSADLNALGMVANGNVVGLEEISATDAESGVVIALTAQSEAFTITGSGHDDTIATGSGADWIDGGDGDDVLSGGAGQDTLLGADGADILLGGAGDDILFADASDDFVDGGANASNNLLVAGNRGDVLAVSGVFDFTSLDNIFANIETISMLGSEGSPGPDSITLSIDDVLQMTGTGRANPAGSAPGGGAYDQRPALRIDGDSDDILNLSDDSGSWLPAIGATGIPDGYTAYAHVTAGSSPGQNEDAYLFVMTGITLNAA